MNVSALKYSAYIPYYTAVYLLLRSIFRFQEFRLKHYAGDVVYNVNGFVDKNNDLLFRDMKEVLSFSEDALISGMFPAAELESKKRPPTVRSLLLSLMLLLLLLLLLLLFLYCMCTHRSWSIGYHVYFIRYISCIL